VNIQNDKTLVDQAAAAEILQVRPYTLTNWRCNKRYPLPYIKVGRCVRYRISDLIQFMENNRITGEGEE
jgi:hypothetical protein